MRPTQEDLDNYVNSTCHAQSEFDAGVHVCGQPKGHTGKHKCASITCPTDWGHDWDNTYSKWKFSIRDGVFGHITSPIRSRWIAWDAPWTEDVKAYDCPMRFNYYGKKWCWQFGAKSQRYDWKNDRFADWREDSSWRRFVVYPSNCRERFEASQK